MLSTEIRPGGRLEFVAGAEGVVVRVTNSGGLVLDEGMREDFRREMLSRHLVCPCVLTRNPVDMCWLEVGSYGVWVVNTGWKAGNWQLLIDAPREVEILGIRRGTDAGYRYSA